MSAEGTDRTKGLVLGFSSWMGQSGDGWCVFDPIEINSISLQQQEYVKEMGFLM